MMGETAAAACPTRPSLIKPKGFCSAYVFFITEFSEEVHKRKNPECWTQPEIVKKAAVRWKNMKEHEKTKYKILENADRKRADFEMKRYKYQCKKYKVVKPKQKRSPVNCYVKANRELLRKECPSLTFFGITKELIRRWQSLSGEEREEYEKMAEEDKLRSKKEIKEFKKDLKQGTEVSKKNKKSAIKESKQGIKLGNVCSKELISESDSDSE